MLLQACANVAGTATSWRRDERHVKTNTYVTFSLVRMLLTMPESLDSREGAHTCQIKQDLGSEKDMQVKRYSSCWDATELKQHSKKDIQVEEHGELILACDASAQCIATRLHVFAADIDLV
jgi:hypothetical protein